METSKETLSFKNDVSDRISEEVKLSSNKIPFTQDKTNQFSNEIIKHKVSIPPKTNKLKQLDPKLYEVNMKDVKKKYEDMKKTKSESMLNSSFSKQSVRITSVKSKEKEKKIISKANKNKVEKSSNDSTLIDKDKNMTYLNEKEKDKDNNKEKEHEIQSNSIIKLQSNIEDIDELKSELVSTQEKLTDKVNNKHSHLILTPSTIKKRASKKIFELDSRSNSKSIDKVDNLRNRRRYDSKINQFNNKLISNKRQSLINSNNNNSNNFNKEKDPNTHYNESTGLLPPPKNKNQILKQLREKNKSHEDNIIFEETVDSNEIPKVNINKLKSKKALEQPITSRIVNKVNIEEMNFLLEKKQDDQIKLDIKSSKCSYCIKKLNTPIILKCGHFMCLNCAVELRSIGEFMKEEKINYLKCPECSLKTFFNVDTDKSKDHTGYCLINEIEKEIMSTLMIKGFDDENQDKSIHIIDCEICPTSKEIKGSAEHECLNCDVVMCHDCKYRHLSNSRHQDHKVIQINNQFQERTESTLCEIHKEPLKLFCLTEKKPCCLVCTNYDNLHGNHEVKSMKYIIDNALVEFSLLIREGEPKIRFLEYYTSDLMKLKQKLSDEHNFFQTKLSNTIENLILLIRQKQTSLESQLENIFTQKINDLTKKINIFSMLYQKFNFLKQYHTEKDIDILKKIKRVMSLNKNIQKLEAKDILVIDKFDNLDSNALNDNNSLLPSVFINEPFDKIRKHLTKFNFLPISNYHIKVLIDLFTNSNTMASKLITPELCAVLPKIRSGKLIYRISKDGASSESFHKNCDNKGPTLIIIKTADGHVFGGFNPLSWINENMYNETEEAFLFSVTDGNYRQPIKCPIRKSKKHFAIKQNNIEFSPGFGETNEADLFIAFKNISKSYSLLGNTYTCPEGYNASSFLAGKESEWEIVDVEVFAIDVISEEDYYNFLNI